MAFSQNAMERLGQRLVQVAEMATAYHLAISRSDVDADSQPADQAAGLRAAVRAMARSQPQSGHFAASPSWR